jgi:hypothetical protein
MFCSVQNTFYDCSAGTSNDCCAAVLLVHPVGVSLRNMVAQLLHGVVLRNTAGCRQKSGRAQQSGWVGGWVLMCCQSRDGNL